MRYLLRFLLLVVAAGSILGARRVSRTQPNQPAPVKNTAPVAQLPSPYLFQATR